MAHVAKYKAPQVAAMVRHWERGNKHYSNENIDPSRTPQNYGWVRQGGAAAYLDTRLEGLNRKVRKDAVVCADWVITAPDDLRQGDYRRFFEVCVSFLEGRYGADNLLSAQVHMDETTPHLHYAFVPITQDGRLSAKDMLNRADLKSFHGDLSAAVTRGLGYEVSILLPEEEKERKALSHLPQSELAAGEAALEKARQELAEARETVEKVAGVATTLMQEKEGLERDIKALTDRLECLRREERGLEKEVGELEAQSVELPRQTFGESLRTLAETRNDGEREESLGREIEGLRERISQCQDGIQEYRSRSEYARERIPELDRKVWRLESARAGLARRVGELEKGVSRILGRVMEIPSLMPRIVRDIAEKIGCKVLDPMQWRMREARLASRDLARDNPQKSVEHHISR